MKRPAITAIALAVAGSSAAQSALAADRATPPADRATPASPPLADLVPKERPTRREFYGWEILATGEVGAAVASASVLLPDKALDTLPSTFGFFVGMPIYALGGPIVHWTHGEFEKGLLAFGGNFVVPMIGGFAGRSLRCAEQNAPIDCGARGFFTGLGVAVLVAPVIDAFALGWQNVPLEDTVTSARLDRRQRASPTLVPTWTLGPAGLVELGVAGRF